MRVPEGDGTPAGQVLLVVSDGMGGSLAGEVASELTVNTVVEGYGALGDEDPGDSLRRALERREPTGPRAQHHRSLVERDGRHLHRGRDHRGPGLGRARRRQPRLLDPRRPHPHADPRPLAGRAARRAQRARSRQRAGGSAPQRGDAVHRLRGDRRGGRHSRAGSRAGRHHLAVLGRSPRPDLRRGDRRSVVAGRPRARLRRADPARQRSGDPTTSPWSWRGSKVRRPRRRRAPALRASHADAGRADHAARRGAGSGSLDGAGDAAHSDRVEAGPEPTIEARVR